METTKPSLDQRRAIHAWNAVKQAKALRDSADYAREAKRLPVRIKTSGLGQSLAFMRAKAGSGEARRKLLSDIGEWVLRERGFRQAPPSGIDDSTLIQAIIEGDAGLLRRATEEVLLYLQWLTRFTEAEIKSDD